MSDPQVIVNTFIWLCLGLALLLVVAGIVMHFFENE